MNKKAYSTIDLSARCNAQMGVKMRKGKILPRLAVMGVMKNGILYFPYLFTGVLSVFIWFVFSSILHNDIIENLPRAAYVGVLLQIGRVLLGIILLPFLFYANSFLIKRRTKEIGLYSLLGLEKKHIGMMMLLEAVLIYSLVMAGGILAGVVFSRMAFLLLLNMTGMPIDVQFVFTKEAFLETAVFFLAAYGLNLGMNLVEVGRSNPIQLLGSGKKGEKEPRFLVIPALLGAAVLILGYWIAVRTKIDSMIFLNFFFAVFLVIVGTYLLFTTGSILVLKLMKNYKKLYYRPDHFITISGMFYRMKKNAASLSNICIFSTMVIITMTCTLSLYLGMDDVKDFMSPNDIVLRFGSKQLPQEEVLKKVEELEKKYQVKVTDASFYTEYNQMMRKGGSGYIGVENSYSNDENEMFHFLVLEDYNQLEQSDKVLMEDEVLFFSTGPDLASKIIELGGVSYVIQEELTTFKTLRKSLRNQFYSDYYVIFSDEGARDAALQNIASAQEVKSDLTAGSGDLLCLMAEGDRINLDAFIGELKVLCSEMEGYGFIKNGYSSREVTDSIYGGLLFIGVFFGLIFAMCLLLIMYYKQISEGYEDQRGFEIMQQVGMSDEEIRKTIRKQIQLVFFLPLFGAVLHTLSGIPMVNELFGTISLFNGKLVFGCAGIVCLIFLMFYAGSYLLTAKVYYKIIKM